MIAKATISTCINVDTIAEDVYGLNLTVTDKLHREMLQDIRRSLGEVLFRKEYIYTKITEYLDRMYESINDNLIIINALDRIKKIDQYTFTHSINTAFYSMFIAIWMGLNDQQVINAT
jgi:HD-GYP domain-containing protein (c-di-GMP phosphodiesterase class II)